MLESFPLTEGPTQLIEDEFSIFFLPVLFTKEQQFVWFMVHSPARAVYIACFTSGANEGQNIDQGVNLL
ncbi:hypothetical protein ACJX0J_025634, partial [Zea mays]